MPTYHIIETCLEHNIDVLGLTYKGKPPDLYDGVIVDPEWCTVCTTHEHGSSKRWQLTIIDNEELTTAQIEERFAVYARGTKKGKQKLAELNTKNEIAGRKRLSATN